MYIFINSHYEKRIICKDGVKKTDPVTHGYRPKKRFFRKMRDACVIFLDFIQNILDFYQKKEYITAGSSKMNVQMKMVSYNKLWKRMIDCGLNKTQLREKAGVSTNAIAKIGKGENVSMDVLIKICKALQCDIADVIELVEDGTVKNG